MINITPFENNTMICDTHIQYCKNIRNVSCLFTNPSVSPIIFLLFPSFLWLHPKSFPLLRHFRKAPIFSFTFRVSYNLSTFLRTYFTHTRHMFTSGFDNMVAILTTENKLFRAHMYFSSRC